MSAASYDFRFDSGRLCLDLVATVGGRLSGAPVERLDSPDRLAEWLTHSGLLPTGQPLDVGPDWLTRFHALRALLHRLAHAAVDRRRFTPDDVRRLNVFAAAAPPVPAFAPDGDTIQVRLVEPVSADALLSAIARDAIDLFAGPLVEQLRECAGDTCDLVYVDTSRGRRRRWCSSTACGNRVRVSRHRERSVTPGYEG